MYHQIPYELEQKLEKELQVEESVQWQGMPVPRFFKAETIAISLFAIPWTAFSIFWICAASEFKIPDLSGGFKPEMLFPLFGLPFVLIGLGMLSSPVFAYLKDKKTLYAITNRRVIIITGGRSFEIKSLSASQIEETTRRERGDLGDLIIAHKHWKDSDGDSKSTEIGLFNVYNVMEADRSLQRLLANQIETEQNKNDWTLKE